MITLFTVPPVRGYSDKSEALFNRFVHALQNSALVSCSRVKMMVVAVVVSHECRSVTHTH